MASRRTIRAFDLFCGAGGSSCGAQLAGVSVVGALDMWPLATETMQLNFPDARIYRMKARSLSARRVVAEVGRVDLLLASPECTNHSVAKGNAPRCETSRATAFEVCRFARVLQPRWIVVENVIQMRYWDRYAAWLRKLERIGYNISTAVLNAMDYGAPQSRRRLFILGDLESEPTIPPPRPGRQKTAASILGCGESQHAPWRFTPLRSKERAKATITRAKRAIRKVGRSQPFIMVYYGSDGAGGFQSIDRPLRTVTTLDRFALVRPNCRGHEMRMLQPPELAAAMGFPRSFKWPQTSRRNRIHLVGNAVCPPLMRDVVKHLTRAK